jgi:hypothetical protein
MKRARLVEEMSGCKYLVFFLLFAVLGLFVCALIIWMLIPTLDAMAQQPPLMTLLTLGIVALLGGLSYLVARAILSLLSIEKKP